MDTIRPITDNFLIRHATYIAIGAVTVFMLLAALVFWRQERASLRPRAGRKEIPGGDEGRYKIESHSCHHANQLAVTHGHPRMLRAVCQLLCR